MRTVLDTKTELTKKDIAAISKIILSPNRDNKVFLHQQGDGDSHWIVRYKDAKYRVVFNERSKTTKTFLEFLHIHEVIWSETHDSAGKPTLGDYDRIRKLKLK